MVARVGKCPSPGTKALAAIRIKHLWEAVMGKTVSSSVNPCTHGQVEGTTTLERAAALIGMDPKRLAGRIWRDKAGDPVGCKVCGDVYTNTLPTPVDSSVSRP